MRVQYNLGILKITKPYLVQIHLETCMRLGQVIHTAKVDTRQIFPHTKACMRLKQRKNGSPVFLTLLSDASGTNRFQRAA